MVLYCITNYKNIVINDHICIYTLTFYYHFFIEKKLNFIFFMNYINKKSLLTYINMSQKELQERLNNYYKQLDTEYNHDNKYKIDEICIKLQTKISEMRSNENNHVSSHHVGSTDYGIYKSISYGPCTPSVIGLTWGSSGFHSNYK